MSVVSKKWQTYDDLNSYWTISGLGKVYTVPELCIKGETNSTCVGGSQYFTTFKYIWDSGEIDAEWKDLKEIGVIPLTSGMSDPGWLSRIEITVYTSNINPTGPTPPFDTRTFQFTSTGEKLGDLSGMKGRYIRLDIMPVLAILNPGDWDGSKFKNAESCYPGGQIWTSSVDFNFGTHPWGTVGVNNYWTRPVASFTDNTPKVNYVRMSQPAWTIFGGSQTPLALGRYYRTTKYFGTRDLTFPGAPDGYPPWEANPSLDWESYSLVLKSISVNGEVNSNDNIVARFGSYSQNLQNTGGTWLQNFFIFGAGNYRWSIDPFEWGKNEPITQYVWGPVWHDPDATNIHGTTENMWHPNYDAPKINDVTLTWAYYRWWPVRVNSFEVSYGEEEPVPPPEPTFECEDIRVFGTTCADTVQDKAVVPIKIGEGEVRRGSLYSGADEASIENLVKGQTTFADELHGHKSIQNLYDEWAKRWYYKKHLYKPQAKPAEDIQNGAGIIGFKTTRATSSIFPPAYNIDNVDEALFALSWWMRDLRKKPLPVIQETMHSSGRLLNLTFVPLPDNHLNGGFWKDGIPVIEEQCSWIVSPTFLWGLGGAHAPWVYLCTTLGLGQGGEYTEEGAQHWDWPGWLKFFEALCNGQFMYGRWLIHFLITSGGDILTSLLTILGTHANYHIVGTHWWGTEEEQQVIDHKSYRSFPLIDMAGVNLLSLSSNTPKTPVPPIATIKHTYVGGTHRLQYKAPTDTYGSEIILPKYKDAVYQLNSNNTSYWCKVNIVYNLLQSVPLETADINTLGYINGWTAIKKQYVESQMEAQHNGTGYPINEWNPWWIDNK